MATTTDTELLTEHFGYPPVSLLDDIINSINILAERALNSVEQGLLNAPPASLGFRPPTHASTTKPGKKPKKGEEGLPNAEEAHRHEIENGTHQLETLLCASIDRNFDKFEIYVMRNILCVRPEDRDWIRLGHYEGLDFSSSPQKEGGDERPTLETVTRLRRRLQASQKLNVMLHAEKARNAALLSEVRRLIGSPKQIKSERQQPPPLPQTQTQNGNDNNNNNNNTDTEMTDAPPPFSTTPTDTDTTSTASKPPFGFLTQPSLLSTSDASTPLTTTTAFTLSQLDALRSLSTSLRSLLPALSQPVTATEPEPASTESPDEPKEEDNNRKKKPWRLQRLEYIETATRKHLEQVRGLELGVNGELRDGGELGGEEQSITGDLMVVVVENGGDGDGDGDGARRTTKRRRVVEREEVEALEGVLGSLGGGLGHDGDSKGAGEEGGEGGHGQAQEQEQKQEQEQNEERQEEGQTQAQSEGSQREGGEGKTETETPRQRGGSVEKAKDQADGEEGRMDES
ncbi:Mis12 domain-containing protein [Neurospora intermedia]|uniref:Mis12 domain-containing protein n=1 Tax=Neurospora intermedia TaxID=5142 RepID=A0ABR3DMC3_NEUIN